MNIVIKKGLFYEPVSKLSPVSERRGTMPILSNILISFDKDKTTLFANDLDVNVIAYADYTVDEEKKILINGRRFFEILKEMGQEDIELDIQENTLKIKQKKTEYILGLQDPNDFPEPTEVDVNNEVTIDGGILLEIIDKVGFAISKDETRHTLLGIYMEGKENMIHAVGTDGFRMAVLSRDIEGIQDFKGIIIPEKTFNDLDRVLKVGDKVRLSIGDTNIRFSTERISIISKLIEGIFPDFRNIVPEKNPNIAIIEKEMFLKSLKKVSAIIDKSEPVKMLLYNGLMELDAESDIGSAKEVVEIDYKGLDLSMNFNIRFLFDVVNHTDNEYIVMKAPDKHGAVLFVGKDDERYKNIVMPVRV
ncbi:MAG: DNA polymerase III subunit beta [Syntrophorhabdaceae bacterium]|nr:DNA polymerase III subunit beta [Syntrophorhabdaceae bacterium]